MNDGSWMCSICLEDNKKDCFILEPCMHKFHVKCLISSLRKCGPKCPYCRGEDKDVEKCVNQDLLEELGMEEGMLMGSELQSIIYRFVNYEYFN